MQSRDSRYCKVTVSLPCALIDYADQEAARTSLSRSEIIGRALVQAQRARRDELAARGYALYAQESEAFATAAGELVTDWSDEEDWGDAG